MAIYLGGETATEKRNLDDLTPRQIVAELDKYVVGQNAAKKAVAVALRNRIRRQKLPAEIADELIEKPAKLPETWRADPYSPESQGFGTDWIKAQRSVALRVPSVVVPGEFNYLLNPAHPQFSRIRIGQPEPFSFDPRLA